jgi:hypothetical protein
MIEPVDAAFHAGSASIIFAKPAEHFRAMWLISSFPSFFV